MYICLNRKRSINLSKSLPISESVSRLKDLLYYYFSLILEKKTAITNPHLYSDHADELEIFFETPEPFATSVVADAKDNALFYSMREYWTSFVTTGRPVSKQWYWYDFLYPLLEKIAKTQKD